MNNVVKVILPYTIGILVSIIALVFIIIFHKKGWIPWSIILSILIALAIYLSYPFYVDINKKEFLETEGILINTSSLGKAPLFSTALIIEQNEGSTIEIIVPAFDYEKYNLKFNKQYKIVYYKNSQVLYSIELIE